jgi:uroporphyrinogen-III synthase
MGMPVDGAADRPLAGVGVVVTRDDGEAAVLSRALRSRGATVHHWPTVRWAPPGDPAPLIAELGRLSSFDWIAFTSPRAVAAVAERRHALPSRLRVAVVGSATADAARLRGWRTDLVPEVQTAESLVSAMEAAGVATRARVLFPASEIAGTTLEDGLRANGAQVVRVAAYCTLPVPVDRAACARALSAGTVKVISFASPSSVRGLATGLGESLFREATETTVMAAIGPTTGAALRSAGARRVIEASDHSLVGLADRIAEWAHQQGEIHELSHD